MKLVLAFALFALAAAEAGFVSPLFIPHPANSFVYPLELRKLVTYTKPVVYPTQLFKPELYQYTFPVVHTPIVQSAPLVVVKPAPSTVVAKADAASHSGAVGSSVVARSDDAVPFSVVANAGPGAAYSSAVVHPSPISAVPYTAGAQASVVGGAH